MNPAPRAERASSFFLGFLALSKPQREALSAVYAYCRRIDDIVDSGHLRQDEARRMLAFWREEVARLYAGRPTHSISAALEGPIAQYALPQDSLLEMIRGCEMDLDGVVYETAADLESYMSGVASSVGVLCVHIFGWRHTPRERMLTFAKTFGHAFQLTNIIRDVGVDLELGRVYLPQDDIRAAGYSLERLKRREYGADFSRLMKRQHARAKAYYAAARELLDPRDLPAMLPAELMAHVYEGLLEEIARREFRVLDAKIRLSSARKLALALRGWLYCHSFF